MRNQIGLLCLTFAFALMVLLISGRAVFAAGHDTASCQAECGKCASLCEKTEAYCKKQGGQHTEAAHIKKLEDCAKMCRTSADFMKRDSDESGKVCALCQDLCTKCADSCDQMKDPKMKECADECRKCADHCKNMAS
jgi:hypothetical protein